MGEVHHLVITHGRDAAKRLAPDKGRLIDIAADLLAEEGGEAGYVYSGFCLTALPHRPLAPDAIWEKVAMSGRLKLTISPGVIPSISGPPKRYPVPSGSYARLILLYLQSVAVKTGSPTVELGASMHDWLGRMGISPGGKTYTHIREQSRRIMACSLTFSWDKPGVGDHFERDTIIRSGSLPFLTGGGDARQASLFAEEVTLSESFFRAVVDHPVPLWEPAIRHLASSSMALDIYVWLAFRLHSLAKPTNVSWTSVFTQFGGGFSPKSIRSFRQTFKEALALALATYPDARVDVDKAGLVLHPSRPPVAKLACS